LLATDDAAKTKGWRWQMTDFRTLARHVPAVRSYLRHRRWIKRGDVLAYAPNIQSDVFSTDAFGFRRGRLNGASYDVNAAFSGDAYGIVLGSSHVFGYGLASDEETIPSQLAKAVGFPCLNISFPEAQLHALHAVATRICAQAQTAPAFIALLPGGTLTRYAFVRSCDPLFGVPDFRQATDETCDPGTDAEAYQFRHLLAYSRYWIAQIAQLCQSRKVPFLLHPEATAFEKPTLSGLEIDCGLTTARSQADLLRFATHRHRYPAYTSGLIRSAEGQAKLATCLPERLTFIDEFHYTSDGAGIVAGCLSAAL
jgi:hypothetical protein